MVAGLLSSSAVTFVTGNVNLVPTIILLGSFLAPVGHGLWLLALDALVGVLILRGRWHRAISPDQPHTPPRA